MSDDADVVTKDRWPLKVALLGAGRIGTNHGEILANRVPGVELAMIFDPVDGGAILAAVEGLGVQPLAVEKDYWVCEALRSIVAAQPGEVVFKGGTGLDKPRIIRRFSEDLDLLEVGGCAVFT